MWKTVLMVKKAAPHGICRVSVVGLAAAHVIVSGMQSTYDLKPIIVFDNINASCFHQAHRMHDTLSLSQMLFYEA